jgi:hypothetical protein
VRTLWWSGSSTPRPSGRAIHQARQRGAMQRRRIVALGFRVSSRGRKHAAVSRHPPTCPLHDCRPYRGLHVRRERLGVVHRTRTIFCRPVPNLNTIRNFCIAVDHRDAFEACALCWSGPSSPWARERTSHVFPRGVFFRRRGPYPGTRVLPARPPCG